MTRFLIEKHVEFIHSLDSKKNCLEYWLSEHLRLNGIYWAVTSLALMDKLNEFDKSSVIDQVLSCQCKSSGGFGGNTGFDPHLLFTTSAIQILVIYDALDSIDVEQTVNYIIQLQDTNTGAFMGDEWGEIDTRFSYCAILSLHLLGRLDALSTQNQEKAIEFISSCRNVDGGYGCIPGAESHAGQIFCCIGALSLLNALDRFDHSKLIWWLSKRQLPNGGLNGRPEKKEDVCYSWWVLSSLCMLESVDYINKDKLIEFILISQDEELGGIADRPGDMPDVFHTLFGIAGLSLLGYDGLKPVDARVCMPIN